MSDKQTLLKLKVQPSFYSHQIQSASIIPKFQQNYLKDRLQNLSQMNKSYQQLDKANIFQGTFFSNQSKKIFKNDVQPHFNKKSMHSSKGLILQKREPIPIKINKKGYKQQAAKLDNQNNDIVGTLCSEFKQPDQYVILILSQDICKAIEGLRQLLPYCSIQRVVVVLYKLLVPKQLQQGQNLYKKKSHTKIAKNNTKISYFQSRQPLQINQSKKTSYYHINNSQDQQIFDERSEEVNYQLSQIDDNDSNQNRSQISFNKGATGYLRQYQPLTHESKTGQKGFIKRQGHTGGVTKWLKKLEEMPKSDPIFKQQRRVAKVFIAYGPSQEAANVFLKDSPYLKKIYNIYRNICRTTVRKLQDYMKENFNFQITLVSKQNLTFLSTSLIHCRQWMNIKQMQIFFVFLKMIYQIKLNQDEKHIKKQDVISFYQSLVDILKEKLISLYEKKGQLAEDYENGASYQNLNKIIQSFQQSKKLLKNQTSLPLKTKNQDLQQIQSIKVKNQEDSSISNGINQSKHEFFIDDYFEPYIEKKHQNSFWNQQYQRAFVQFYTASRKLAVVKEDMISAFPQLSSILTVKEVKAKMQKLCRQGLKKVQALYTHLKSEGGLKQFDQIPPTNDIIIKFILRSPYGNELRISLIQVLLYHDPDRYYLENTLREMVKFARQQRQEILTQLNKPYNRSKSKDSDVMAYMKAEDQPQ